MNVDQAMQPREQDGRGNWSCLIDWLKRQDWEIWCLQTFRAQCRQWGAQAIWSHCLAEWHSVFGMTAAVFALEPHATGSRWHVHGLLSMNWPEKWRRHESPSACASQRSSDKCQASKRAWLRSSGSIGASRIDALASTTTKSNSIPLWRVAKEHFGKRVGWCRPRPIPQGQSTAAILRYTLKYALKDRDPDTWGIWTKPLQPSSMPSTPTFLPDTPADQMWRTEV
jgi:hypothetical protein